MFGIDDALLVAGGASLAGSLIGADSAKDAANTQANATNRAIAQTQSQFDTNRGDTAPYRAAGKSALEQLQALLGQQVDPQQQAADAYLKANPDVAANSFYGANPYQHFLDHGQAEGRQWNVPAPAADPSQTDPSFGALNKKFSISDFWNDPVVQASYQSGLDLGTKALRNAAPLTTGLDSGAALKELTKFGTDYTGNMAAGSQARFVGDQTNQFNKLATIAGVGQTGVAQAGAAGSNFSNNASNLITSGANAQGAAKIAGANAFSGGLTSISNYWQQQQMLDRLKSGGAGTGTTGYSNPTANYSWADLNAG